MGGGVNKKGEGGSGLMSVDRTPTGGGRVLRRSFVGKVPRFGGGGGPVRELVK